MPDPKTIDCFESASGMRVFYVSPEQQLQLDTSSKGNQRKWLVDNMYVKEQFFYQGKYWKDDQVEVIASTIAKQMINSSPVAQQELCEIHHASGSITKGSCSHNFCEEDERFLSFNRLCLLLHEDILLYKDYKDRYQKAIEILNRVCKCGELYLNTMILLDYLVGNEDRHLNNFGVIATGTGFRVAPLFDFGLGLFEHDLRYNGEPFRECLKMMQSKPFSRDNQKIVDFILTRGATALLPATIDLSSVQIPSAKAGSYIRNRCSILGIELHGVE